MAKKILQTYDFTTNQIIDVKLENLASFPTAGNAGRPVFNTTTGKLGVDDGTTFSSLLTSVTWNDVTGKPTEFTPSTHSHTIAQVTGLQAALDDKAAIDSPVFTGTPISTTPITSDDSTKIATTAYVKSSISALASGDMLKSEYDSDDNGKVDCAEVAESVTWANITSKPTEFTPVSHTHTASEVTDFSATVDARIIAFI